MRCCSSAASAPTTFNKRLSSSVAIGNVLRRPPETQIGGLSFLVSGGGDFASSRRNLLPLLSLGRNRIRSVANSSTPFSEPQDELEAINDSQPPFPDQETLSSVRIKIQLRKECQFGEQFFVVGSKQELGLWNPLHAIPMAWSDDHLWTAELDLPIGESIQFKFLLREVNGELLWQPGKDRVFHTWETNNIISIFEDWENPEAQQVTEEQESDALNTKNLEHSNEKFNEEDEGVVIIADDFSHHTKADTDRQKQEPVEGHLELDEATNRLGFNDERASMVLEKWNELAPKNDEGVNGRQDQDLETAFSESQINEGTDLWGDDMKLGESRLKRFLNSLGFPWFLSSFSSQNRQM